MSYSQLVGSELVESEDEGKEEAGKDEVFIEKATVEQRYQTLQEEPTELREQVEATTTKRTLTPFPYSYTTAQSFLAQSTHNCTGFPTAQSLLGLNINYCDNTGKSISPGR